MQDDFRDKKGDITALCMKIIEENDRRFRVKKKINDLVNSSLKEQKGYARTKALILTHFGNGDHGKEVLLTKLMIKQFPIIFDTKSFFCCTLNKLVSTCISVLSAFKNSSEKP